MKPGFVCFLNERLTRDATQRVVESHLICTQAGDYKVVLCIRRSL